MKCPKCQSSEVFRISRVLWMRIVPKETLIYSSATIPAGIKT
jgi:hypothetical protein